MDIRKNHKTILLTGVLLLYVIFNAILLARHELWRDEANVWLLARDTSPLQLFHEIRYQGHPCLWYYVVMPFAKMNLPFWTISVISYLIMLVTAVIFVYKAPFSPLTKLICLGSPIFSYYYPVVARNYCLIALLLLLLALLYEKRKEKPLYYGLLLGLLVQADTIALGAAGLISLMWLWEAVSCFRKEHDKKAFFRIGLGLCIPLASFLLWIAEFAHVSDSPEFNVRAMSVQELLKEVKNSALYIVERMTGQGAWFAWTLLIGVLMVGILLCWQLRNFWPLLVLAGGYFFVALFHTLVYQLHMWHFISLAFLLIWFLWMVWPKSSGKGISTVSRWAAEGLMLILCIAAFYQWNSPDESSNLANAWDGVYSDAMQTADYIRQQQIGADEVILSTNVSEASTVLAYLGNPYHFTYAGNQSSASYADYTKDQDCTISYEEFMNYVQVRYSKKEAIYVLVSPGCCISDLPEEQILKKDHWELCYQSAEKSAKGEEYALYRLKLS